MAIEIRPLEASFGAQVLGLDPEAPLDEPTKAGLRTAFDEHGLLVFRDRVIPFAVQVELCELLVHGDDRSLRVGGEAGPSDDYYVSNTKEDGATPFGRLPFHLDGMWSTQPYLALSLCAMEIEEPSVPTCYASMARAWTTLPDDLRHRVEGLHARHALVVIPRGEHPEEVVVADFGLDFSQTKPVAHHHPRTGRPLLYVSQQMTTEIVDIDPEASEALLGDLFDHLYQPANLLEHTWRAGDLVIWDNVAVQHSRPDVQADGPVRTLRKYGTPDIVMEAVPDVAYSRASD